MATKDLATIEFSLTWKSSYGEHVDKRLVEKMHFWRDIFPGSMGQHLEQLKPQETYSENFAPGILVPYYTDAHLKTIKSHHLEDNEGNRVPPHVGKFYPQGWAWKALNCFPPNRTPFRVLERHKELFVADTNHPLARFPIRVEAKMIERWQPNKERGGECKDIASILTSDGPGLQLPYQWLGQDSYSPYPFIREKDDDASYYHGARLVNHLDDTALNNLESIYSRLLCPGDKILDLMSSYNSHLSEDFRRSHITGLGMNKEELHQNKMLSYNLVHDLNTRPTLPFENSTFEAVICSLSIEYLTKPLEVMEEIARVTVPGGKFITTFSNRWFAGKEIQPWADLHEFERLGLVLDYYRRVGHFENIRTETIRGYPRPFDDPHIDKTWYSDPLFAIWADVKWS